MLVTVHLKACYDWVPVPSDVKITEADKKFGRVMPDRQGNWRMKLVKKGETFTTVGVSEKTLCERIILELIPRPGMVKRGSCNRAEALAHLLEGNVMGDHAHPSHMTGFVVECDQGPDERLFRLLLAEKGIGNFHHMTGEPLVPPEECEAIVARYMEPVSHEDHVNALHAKFGVKKVVAA